MKSKCAGFSCCSCCGSLYKMPKKLALWFLGPFSIQDILNPVTVRLALPRSMKVHNVFHVPMVPALRAPATRPVDESVKQTDQLSCDITSILFTVQGCNHDNDTSVHDQLFHFRQIGPTLPVEQTQLLQHLFSILVLIASLCLWAEDKSFPSFN